MKHPEKDQNDFFETLSLEELKNLLLKEMKPVAAELEIANSQEWTALLKKEAQAAKELW